MKTRMLLLSVVDSGLSPDARPPITSGDPVATGRSFRKIGTGLFKSTSTYQIEHIKGTQEKAEEHRQTVYTQHGII